MKFRPVEDESFHEDKWTDIHDAANSCFLPNVWRTSLELLQSHTIELLKRGFCPPAPLISLIHCYSPAKNNRLVVLKDIKVLFT